MIPTGPRDPPPPRPLPLGRRLRVHAAYLGEPARDFLPTLVFAALFLLVGALCLRHLWPGKPLGFGRSLWLTSQLFLNNQILPAPESWAIRGLYIVLPAVWLVVVAEGFLRFGYHVLRVDEAGREWTRAMASTTKDHVILCGLGNAGFRVLQELQRLEEDVVVLEKNPDCPHLGYARRRGVPVLVGSAKDEGMLEDMNVGGARSIILCTNDDLANLEMALDARRMNPRIRVVLRLYDQELARKVREEFKIDLAFSRSQIAAPLFATASTDRSVMNAFYLGERLFVVAQLVVNGEGELAGKTVGELEDASRVVVLSHLRDGKRSFWPDGGATLRPGDRVDLQCEPATLRAFHKKNRDPEPY